MSKITSMLGAILGKKPDGGDQVRYEIDESIALPEEELDGAAKLLLTGDAKAIFREFETFVRLVPAADQNLLAEQNMWIERELVIAELLIDVFVWARGQEPFPTLHVYFQFRSGYKAPGYWFSFLDDMRYRDALPLDLRKRIASCREEFPANAEFALVGIQFNAWLGRCLGLGPKTVQEESDNPAWQDPAVVALEILQSLVDACDLLDDVPEEIEAALDDAHALLARVAAEERERAAAYSGPEPDMKKIASGIVFALARSQLLLRQGRSVGLRVGLSPKFKELISAKFPEAAPLIVENCVTIEQS